MKNKYLKGAHISERKVRELLKLFCDDLTATQIANISGISRITVNAYLKLIRSHITLHSEERLPMAGRPVRQAAVNGKKLAEDFSPDLAAIEVAMKKPFYGVQNFNGSIFVEKLSPEDPQEVFDWIKSGGLRNPDVLHRYNLEYYKGLIDFNSVKLYRIADGIPRLANVKSAVDEVELFWNMLKSRLVKFRGLNGNTLNLHVKETEFRFNHRNEDIFELLVDVFHNRPLHVARQYALVQQ
jgi:transposase